MPSTAGCKTDNARAGAAGPAAGPPAPRQPRPQPAQASGESAERQEQHLSTERSTPAVVAELARLEWARVEVFDAPDPAPLRLADLTAVAPADWPALRFRPIAACRILESPWPVHELWAAAAGGPPAAALAPAAATLRVWREGWSVSHAAMGALEVRALRVLEAGEPFAQVCATAAGDGEPAAAAREVGPLLLRWLEDGLLEAR